MDAWRSVVGYSPWGRKELDTTERLHYLSLHYPSSKETSRGGAQIGDMAMRSQRWNLNYGPNISEDEALSKAPPAAAPSLECGLPGPWV